VTVTRLWISAAVAALSVAFAGALPAAAGAPGGPPPTTLNPPPPAQVTVGGPSPNGPATVGGPAPETPVSLPASTTTVTVSPPSTVANSEPSPTTTSTTIRAVRLDTVDAGYLAAVSAEVHRANDALLVAQSADKAAQADAEIKAAAQNRAADALGSLTAQEQAAVAQIRAAHDRLRDLAVSSYVAGGSATPLSALLSAQSLDDLTRRQDAVSEASQANATAMRRFDAARRRASSGALKALAAMQRAQSARRQADASAAATAVLVSQRTNELADKAQLLQLVTSAVGYPGTDIPRIVMDAYRRAAATVAQQQCKLPWAALAGIGEVESHHGRAQGAQLTASGDLIPHILGPALDGQNGTALIPATDGGRFDGDPLYDHAIGPMQILPTTWAVIGRDGDGDGVADPNNIYDATLSAAIYLCRAAPGAQLDTDAGLSQAFFSYNHSDAYVAEVLTLTHAYEAVALTP
jgi:membrane-bound lytic murein transglycosylase B